MRDMKDGCRSVRRCKIKLDLEAVLGRRRCERDDDAYLHGERRYANDGRGSV